MKVALALLAVVVLVSGCISGSHVAYRETGHSEPVITVSDISTDKGIYHSGEQMMISAILHSDMDAAGIEVSVKGISGRLNSAKSVNLTSGTNEIEFGYRLPPCNVCGGIRQGDHVITCEVKNGNATISNSTVISVLQ